MSTLKRVLCALVGHSRIISECMGEIVCKRCEAVIGDALVGSFDAAAFVLMEHACETCETNWETLTWRDKLLAPSRARVFHKPDPCGC